MIPESGALMKRNVVRGCLMGRLGLVLNGVLGEDAGSG